MQDFLANYLDTLGLGGLLGGLIIEALGLPFPGGVMIMFSGFLVNQHQLNFYSVFLVAVLGFNIGAVLAFAIGRYVGDPVFDRYGKFLRIDRRKMEQARDWMEKSAAVFIIIGRFVPMVSNLTPYMAGASGLKWYHFLFYNFIFTIIWVSMNVSVGMLFGHNWPLIAGYFKNQVPLAALALLLLYLVVKYLVRQLHALRSEKI
ncbi:DedA family protein [Desulfoscipio geothermicus]|uniref:Membrane protein DedA, SNARE-associated domain n=1 Tax=Desulfoscipio geothermicus DSM 3669 TaxID=1121426 RepID=A0A1I6CWI0_9FIRM|nr:DedA family protein [Desulfoscipio geothermicus]SFQ97437.1 membrane protein DedA, SNARE-associated domain [Desulfoscipio geothermicus DSM 3669]